jgi:bifunctional DNA-binding transcriptional regulator/antitoxin component of YhaV-PrlF toxin-antitoxin module
MKMIVAVSRDGNLTIPEQARVPLGVEAGGQLELEITERGIALYPVEPLTPEEALSIAQGIADVRAGRLRQLSEEDLLRMIEQR